MKSYSEAYKNAGVDITAGYAAVEILALSDESLAAALAASRKAGAEKVMAKDAALQEKL